MRGATLKSAGEEPVDSPQNSQPLKEQIKQILDAEKNSTSKEENVFPTFYPKLSVRNGFRRKKGDSPLVYNLNLKIKKEKNNPILPTLILGLELKVIEIQQPYIYRW